jgi:hypothetical protein
MTGLKKPFRPRGELDPAERSLVSVTGHASHTTRRGETIAVTFPAELAGFDVDNVAVKILLVFCFVENVAFALLARVS